MIVRILELCFMHGSIAAKIDKRTILILEQVAAELDRAIRASFLLTAWPKGTALCDENFC